MADPSLEGSPDPTADVDLTQTPAAGPLVTTIPVTSEKRKFGLWTVFYFILCLLLIGAIIALLVKLKNYNQCKEEKSTCESSLKTCQNLPKCPCGGSSIQSPISQINKGFALANAGYLLLFQLDGNLGLYQITSEPQQQGQQQVTQQLSPLVGLVRLDTSQAQTQGQGARADFTAQGVFRVLNANNDVIYTLPPTLINNGSSNATGSYTFSLNDSGNLVILGSNSQQIWTGRLSEASNPENPTNPTTPPLGDEMTIQPYNPEAGNPSEGPSESPSEGTPEGASGEVTGQPVHANPPREVSPGQGTKRVPRRYAS